MSYSESYMADWWRRAVRAKCNNRCAICGGIDGLEAHHVIKRSRILTRWDHRNGILLCLACHREAHIDPVVKSRINGIVDIYHLSRMSKVTSKQYFAEAGITKNEYYMTMLASNKHVVRNLEGRNE